MAKKSAPPTTAARRLPSALVKNAEKLAAKKTTELAARGRAEVELIREKQSVVMDAFYDIGEALQRLDNARIIDALGYDSFASLVKTELGYDVQKARDLIEIVTYVPRTLALDFKQEKSHAIVKLIKATPASDTAAAVAKRRKLRLSTGRVFDVVAASARETLAAAAEERRAVAESTKKTKRGVTSTPAERADAAALQRDARAAGMESAKVVAVARPGRGSDVRIEGVAMADLPKLGALIVKRGKTKRAKLSR